MDKVKVKLLFFAKCHELTNIKETEQFFTTPTTLNKLKEELYTVFPILSELHENYVLAINQSYDFNLDQINLKNNDEIAIIPPISGVEDIITQVSHSTCGGIATFIGTTRNNFNEKNVISLEYEAYNEMALKEMNNVCMNVRLKWPNIHKIVIVHRLGLVPIKEASIVIAISSPHRRDCLEAVQFTIDALKATVPIWKKEIYDNGEKSWKENMECKWKTK